MKRVLIAVGILIALYVLLQMFSGYWVDLPVPCDGLDIMKTEKEKAYFGFGICQKYNRSFAGEIECRGNKISVKCK
jgi:hypothetical protein